MKEIIYDSIVVGGGVVGCAIMRKLTLQGQKTLLLERGGDILSGASKANSAILHTGFDAPINSLELKLMKDGYAEYLKIAKKLNLPIIKSGANVVAWNEEMLNSLDGIVEKAHKNGIKDVKKIDKKSILKKEPNLSKDALGAVHVPKEYIIDSWSSPLAYLSQAVENGADYKFNAQVISGKFKDGVWHLKTNNGVFKAKYVINSAGLYADKVQEICSKPTFEIKPRKGQFLVYEKAASKEINSIILPVPTKITKGVLLSETIYGNLILGPTAQEQDNKDEAEVEQVVLKDLIKKGTKMFPNLKNYTVTTTYAGLRTATQHSEYQIYPLKEKNWVCVGGIRSTGLTSSLGIANYVWELLQENFNIKVDAIANKDIVWPSMPNLCEKEKRDYQEEDSLEIICHCENVTKREVNAVFSSFVIPENLQGLKRRTRAMMGACNGFNCSHRINKIYNQKIKNKRDRQEIYDVIIVGSGPSGLGVASGLEKIGKSYLVLERESYLGGIPITCDHHSFGLKRFKWPMRGKNFINKLLKKVDRSRCMVDTSVLKVDEDGTLHVRDTNGLNRYIAKNIVFATGCRESHRHTLLTSGLRPKQIYTTGSLQRLIEANVKLDFKKPVIIGTEIVGFSALMSCFSKSLKPVAMLEESTQISTHPIVKLFPTLTNTPIHFNAKINKINGVNDVESIEIITDEETKTIKCDALIFTGKFIAENTLALNSSLENYIENKIITVNKNGRVGDTNIWACGNVLHPGLSGDLCFSEGEELASSI